MIGGISEMLKVHSNYMFASTKISDNGRRII